MRYEKLKAYLSLGLMTGAVIIGTTLSPVAQDELPEQDRTMPRYTYEGLPEVNRYTKAIDLQASIFPKYYQTHSALRDMKWVERNDSALTEFWDSHANFIMGTLAQLSGLQWLESEFDLYLIRYYHKEGNGDPLIIPVGGIRQGSLTESMPTDSRMQLNLIYQLSHRMLTQAVRFPGDMTHPIASHPLMQAGTHRRDNLAMLLALITSERLLGLDATYAAYQSAFWKQRHPGRELFEKQLLTNWVLTDEQPLTRWILDEPYNSPLVVATRPPRKVRTQASDKPMEYIEDLPLKGLFGFSIMINRTNKRVINKIDPDRLAFACGLREGDIVRSVDGQRVRHQRDMIKKILASYDNGGSTLQIVREDASMTILIQPLDLGYDELPFELNSDLDSLGLPIENSSEPINQNDY